jgi:hypothetical protein
MCWLALRESLLPGMYLQPNEREWGAGTTALMVLRRGDVLHVANLGDSRAVLSRGGVAKQLSQDHTPEVPFTGSVWAVPFSESLFFTLFVVPLIVFSVGQGSH